MTNLSLNREPVLRIGALAERTGMTVEALRYYERRGLLAPAGRRESGYREFRPDAVGLVHFIKRAQSLGFSLAEVEELVRLRERAWIGDAPRQLREAALAKLQDIDHRVRELGVLRDELASLIAACDEACRDGDESTGPFGGARADTGSIGESACPLVEAFDVSDPAGQDARAAAGDTRNVTEKIRTRTSSPAPGRRAGRRKTAPVNDPDSSSRRTP